MNAHKIHHISELIEGCELEAKAAQGRHGRGELPGSLWESISGFANARGGWIVLGVSEAKDKQLTPIGIQEPERLIQELWKALNDDHLIKPAYLTQEDIFTLDQEGRRIIVIHVPAAPVELRPVYVGQDPLMGTYVRRGEGDYRCSPAQVRRMQQRALAAIEQAKQTMTAERWEALESIVAKRAQLSLEALLVALCERHPLTATQLSTLTGLSRHALRAQHLPKLMKRGLIGYLYPDRLTHPGQRYIAPKP